MLAIIQEIDVIQSVIIAACFGFMLGMLAVIVGERKPKQTCVMHGIVWRFGVSHGRACFQTKWATVWDNGVWHTWDKYGVGGENASESNVIKAMEEAYRAAKRQGFVR